jgi:hypothetical protein
MKLIYGGKFKRYFFKCPLECDIFLEAHPDGSPVGFPVTREVRELRTLAHQIASEVWSHRERNLMYIWMAKNTSTGHIGQLDKNEIINLISQLKKLRKLKQCRF